MKMYRRALRRLASILAIVSLVGTGAAAQNRQFEPTVGQAGKDVIWVPTPPETVEKMLDVAGVTAQDFVMDLGSGDGRNVIAAARRGARALGVEFEAKMVDYSTRRAAEAGVADKAKFVQGDMFAADFSQANVLALFLLPSNMLQLRSKFLDLRPGSRIVSNTFGIEGWTPDRTETVPSPCESWCTVHLWIVPAKVNGTWRLANGQLQLMQNFQVVTGTLTVNGMSTQVSGKLTGDQITLQAGGTEYAGRVAGDVIEGTMKGAGQSQFRATRAN